MVRFCFYIPQDPSRVFAEGMHANFLELFYLNTVNDGATAKASTFHALIVLWKNNCPYWLVV